MCTNPFEILTDIKPQDEKKPNNNVETHLLKPLNLIYSHDEFHSVDSTQYGMCLMHANQFQFTLNRNHIINIFTDVCIVNYQVRNIIFE